MSSFEELEIVAEGVETAGQLNYLGSRGCSVCQVYYFCKPILTPGI
jgi:sensor c-di-GMP phosphodiesterase-like protein